MWKKNREKLQQKEHLSRDLGEYRFIKETIKEKQSNRRNIIRRVASITAGAILFGVVAGITFAGTFSLVYSEKREGQQSKIDIEVEEPVETPKPENTPAVVSETAEPTQTPKATAQPTQEPEETSQDDQKSGVAFTLEDSEQFYEQIREVAQEPMKSLVTVFGITDDEDLLTNSTVSYGQAAGVIIADSGEDLFILTENSATQDSQVRVTFCDGQFAQGYLVKEDEDTGLAVVRVPQEYLQDATRENIEVAELGNSYTLEQGKPVIAIGSPSGYNESVVYGTIISVATKVTTVDAEYNLLVTDIQGSQDGNGVLLDTNGSVIGIISQELGGQSSSTVKALPMFQLKTLLAVLSNGEKIRYAGIYGQDISEGVLESVGITHGIYVDSVMTDSPAMIAGIQSADVITEFHGVDITSMQQFSTELQSCKEGENIPVKLMRMRKDGYVEMDFVITIGEK